MNIPPTVIKEYLDEKFAENSVTGREFRTNSLFSEDTKRKLYINLDTGMWMDFKSGEKGNFYHLVSFVENVPYSNARSFIRKLAFDKDISLFEVSTLNVENVPVKRDRTIVGDVKDFFPVSPCSDISSPNYLKRTASKFAHDRGLENFKFFVGRSGRYHQRIIIPYFHKDEVFYFQARTLVDRDPKYLNPSKHAYGIKTSEILYPYDETLDYVIVTEGPIDAMTLRAAGYNATCTQGCKMSTVQAKSIKCEKVVIAYDNDESGREGLQEAKKRLLSQRRDSIYKLVPPKEYKDWNEFWVGGRDSFESYVEKNIVPATWDSFVIERLT